MANQLTFLSISDQIAQLQGRGLTIDDYNIAQQWLIHISYYRLSKYWNIIRNRDVRGNWANFENGYNFSHIAKLYEFDRKLKLQVMDGIERIEVSLRSVLSHEIGKIDVMGHLNFQKIWNSQSFAEYNKFKNKITEFISNSKDSQMIEFINQYPDQSPRIWTAIEQITFGVLNLLLQNINNNVAKKITNIYNMHNMHGITPSDFKEFMKILVEIRNICAHHDMLWNYNLRFKPKHNHIVFKNINHLNNHKIIYCIEIIDYLLHSISPNNQWRGKINTLINDEFPEHKIISRLKMGL